MSETTLRQLALEFGTDKEGRHSYADAYDRHLRHLRDQPVTVLEIGIGGFAGGEVGYRDPTRGGASLRMWKAYFPNGRIVGLDIQDKSPLAEDRVEIVQGDQGDVAVLERVAREFGPFDVIIDDGSHHSSDVIASFEALFPHLKEHGTYAIEDLQTSYWETYGGSSGPDRRGTSMALLQRLVDGLNHAELDVPEYEPTYTDRWVQSIAFYHNLAFVQKGPNDEPSTMLPPHPRPIRYFARPAGQRRQSSGAAAGGPARRSLASAPRRGFRALVPLAIRRALVGAARAPRVSRPSPGRPEAAARRDALPGVKVAIVVVSYNAVGYARRMLRSVRRTAGVDFEIVVVDNDSNLRTRLFWTAQRFLGRINRLALLDRNTFFAEGNNIGVAMAARDATHLLLLNTDCEVLNPAWLRQMLAVHREGATGLRYVTSGPWPRADGFCLLIDRHLWQDGLDESYQWWWSVTGLEARLLRDGWAVQAVRDYADVIVHHGGKSGKAYQQARTADASDEVIAGWFDGHHVSVIDRLPELE